MQGVTKLGLCQVAVKQDMEVEVPEEVFEANAFRVLLLRLLEAPTNYTEMADYSIFHQLTECC